MGRYSCDDCRYIKECIKEFGEYREDGDDYRAVIGTHFCRRSWDCFECSCKCKGQNANNIS